MEPDQPGRRVPGVDLPLIPASSPYPGALDPSPSSGAPPTPEPARAGGTVIVGTLSRDFDTFYRSSRDSVARAVAVTVGDADLAAEAVDEAMARAYQRWARVSGLDNPGGWVYRVALNWSRSVLRRRRHAHTAPGDHVVPAPVATEPAVAQAIAELDHRQRAVVVCRYVLGWSEAETAAALHTPIGTVKSRLHRATRQLSERLAHLRSVEA